MPKHEGGCLCGKVRFELNDDPKVACGCRCQFCQRANGRSLNVHFCPACGTTVTVTTDRFPEAQVMMLGTLDDLSSIKVDMHMFADEGMKWVSFGEGDTFYSKHRLNEDGTPVMPLNI